MRSWKWQYVVPAVLVGSFVLHGFLEGREELLPTLVLTAFAGVPFLLLLVFRRRRRPVMDDPLRAAGVDFATRVFVWWSAILWLMPLISVLVWSGFNFGWMTLVALQPLYAYPLLLFAERLGVRRGRRS